MKETKKCNECNIELNITELNNINGEFFCRVCLNKKKKDYILITKDKIYKLIREMKELRQSLINENNDKDILFRHELKIQANLLELFLKEDEKNNSIDSFFGRIFGKNEQRKLIEKIKNNIEKIKNNNS